MSSGIIIRKKHELLGRFYQYENAILTGELLQEFVRAIRKTAYATTFLRELENIVWIPFSLNNTKYDDCTKSEFEYPEIFNKGAFTLLTIMFGRQWYINHYPSSLKRDFCAREACANIAPITSNHPEHYRIYHAEDAPDFFSSTLPLSWIYDIDLTEETVLILKVQPHSSNFKDHTPKLMRFETFLNTSIPAFQMAMKFTEDILHAKEPTDEFIRQCSILQIVRKSQDQPADFGKSFPNGAGKHRLQEMEVPKIPKKNIKK